MPIEDRNSNIYDAVIVVVNPTNKKYDVINTLSNAHIAINVSDVDTALAIRKAYCDGYYDGKRDQVND